MDVNAQFLKASGVSQQKFIYLIHQYNLETITYYLCLLLVTYKFATNVNQVTVRQFDAQFRNTVLQEGTRGAEQLVIYIQERTKLKKRVLGIQKKLAKSFYLPRKELCYSLVL